MMLADLETWFYILVGLWGALVVATIAVLIAAARINADVEPDQPVRTGEDVTR
ncbi:hypothetical protein [Streptomyces liangshanensis]|uniref:hypothetical protein n=1 Tax=Streptomyces liangshanensis TaxID=2717324 RepID=UPI0036DE4D56